MGESYIEVLSRNPINFEEIKIGEKVRLYAPLRELIKTNPENKLRIRDFLEKSFGGYEFGMEELFWREVFTAYDKRESDLALRINEIPRNSFDFFPVWVNIKYFEPIIVHHNNT